MEKRLMTDLEITIKGKKLSNAQATVLAEAINGHFEFEVQCEGYLEACGIDKKEQREIIEELHSIMY